LIVAFIFRFCDCLFEFLFAQLYIRVGEVRNVLDFHIEILLFFNVEIAFHAQISCVNKLFDILVDFVDLLLCFISCVDPNRREAQLRVSLYVRARGVVPVVAVSTTTDFAF